MKKRLLLFMAALAAVGMLAGCSGTPESDGQKAEDSANEAGNAGNGQDSGHEKDRDGDKDERQENGQGRDYKLGLGVVSRMKKASDAGDGDGSAEVDTVIAAVRLDSEDRIVGCTIDMIQHVIPVSNTGAIGIPAQTEFPTKKELGDEYGLKAASDIGKEWYEQAEAFEQYAIGKTVDEINGIDTDDKGYIQDETLNSSVSISVSDFQAAISKAVENAY